MPLKNSETFKNVICQIYFCKILTKTALIIYFLKDLRIIFIENVTKKLKFNFNLKQSNALIVKFRINGGSNYSVIVILCTWSTSSPPPGLETFFIFFPNCFFILFILQPIHSFLKLKITIFLMISI